MATATSLADFTSIIRSAMSRRTMVPGGKPILLGAWPAAKRVITTGLSSVTASAFSAFSAR